MTASEIEALDGYYGATPKPADFEAFWQARMAEADAVPLDYTVTQAKEVPSWDGCDFLDLWFTGMAGARIYAKYLRPHSDKPVPLVLQFHGYPGASRSFAEQASFAGMGMALIAMDCPGQAGYSVDAGGFLGTTVSGHIVAGLDGPAEGMYYVRLHQDIRILCRIVRQLQEIDLRRVFVNGGSQGGGLALLTACLLPEVKRCAVLNPLPGDFAGAGVAGQDDLDLANFAPLCRAEVLLGSCLMDTYAPPQGQAAIYNRLGGPKQWKMYPKYVHERVNFFENQMLFFFKNGIAE